MLNLMLCAALWSAVPCCGLLCCAVYTDSHGGSETAAVHGGGIRENTGLGGIVAGAL